MQCQNAASIPLVDRRALAALEVRSSAKHRKESRTRRLQLLSPIHTGSASLFVSYKRGAALIGEKAVGGRRQRLTRVQDAIDVERRASPQIAGLLPSRPHVALQRLRASHLSTLVIRRDAETAPKQIPVLQYIVAYDVCTNPRAVLGVRTSPVLVRLLASSTQTT